MKLNRRQLFSSGGAAALSLGLVTPVAAWIHGLNAAANAPKVMLAWGDSLGVGIDPRDRAIDLNWPNVRQVRIRAPFGINSDISPLDQAIAPTGVDYLSSYEYFAKTWADATGSLVYIVSHNFNGSKFGPTGWGIGNPLHEAFIARANAAIQTVIAATVEATTADIVYCDFEASNDAVAGRASPAYKTNRAAAIADIRARVFKNGVSGADTSTVPYVVNGMIPEFLNTADKILYELALRDIAGSITGGRFYKLPEGIHRGDNLHPSVAGMRIIGPAAAALLFDTTPPTMTGIAASGYYTLYESQKILIELTVSGGEYACWSLSGTDAASFEIVTISDGTSGINLSRMRQYLRVVSDGTLSPGVKNFVLSAKDGAGNTTSQAFVVTVLAAYGTTPATIAPALETCVNGAVTNDARSRAQILVTLGAGMNVIVIRKNTGPATDITAMTFNGIVCTRDAANARGNGVWIYYLPSAVAQSGTLLITPDSSTFTSLICEIVSFQGTAAAPASAAILADGNRVSPHVTASIPCPAGGIIVGGGYGPKSGLAPAAGVDQISLNLTVYSAYRNTTGVFGYTSSGSGFSAAVAAAFAPA